MQVSPACTVPSPQLGLKARQATIGVIGIAVITLLIMVHNPVTTSCGGPGVCDNPAKIADKAWRCAGMSEVLQIIGTKGDVRKQSRLSAGFVKILSNCVDSSPIPQGSQPPPPGARR